MLAPLQAIDCMGGSFGLCRSGLRVYVEESPQPLEEERPLIQPPLQLGYMRDRVELAQRVLSKEVSCACRQADASIERARNLPQFKLDVRYTMDEGMRAMYESTVRTEDVKRSVAENLLQIEEGLRIRNEILELTNENYFNERFCELSPTTLQEARNTLSSHVDGANRDG